LTASNPGINRRDVLHIAAASGAASLVASQVDAASDGKDRPLEIVDTNVSLFHWPFRRLPLDVTEKLVKKLRSLGVTQAWAGSFEGILHRDMATVNQRLVRECRQSPELVPIGSVNPLLPDWENDLQRCFQQHDMPAVRLHPNYHGYPLTDPRFARLLQIATAAGRFVQVATLMEDTRTQNPLVRVADVDLGLLVDQVKRVRGARVQVLNWRPRSPLLEKLAAVPGIYFDVARVDSTDGVPQLMSKVPAGQVLFGSHAPFLVPEAALIRTHESGQLDLESMQQLLASNARRFLGKGKP